MKHNFKKMSDEELIALEETADEQTKAAIEKEFARREAEAKGETAETTEAEAETAEGCEDEAELDELLKNCQDKVGHRCKLVPIGTIDWVEGVIVGCVKIKRSKTVAFAVKLDNGKRVIKNYKAPLFEIFDEVVERVKAGRAHSKAEQWSDEKMAEEINKYIVNVGRNIVVKNAEGEDVTGQITGIVPVKRSNAILYRVELPASTEENPKATTTVHKSVVNTSAFIILDETPESNKFYEDYVARRENLANRTPLTGAELVLDLELKLEKAQENVKKCAERVETLKAALEKAKAAKSESEKEGENTDENML